MNLNMVCEFLKGSGNHIHRHAVEDTGRQGGQQC